MCTAEWFVCDLGVHFNWYSGDVSSSKLVGVIGDRVLVGE